MLKAKIVMSTSEMLIGSVISIPKVIILSHICSIGLGYHGGKLTRWMTPLIGKIHAMVAINSHMSKFVAYLTFGAILRCEHSRVGATRWWRSHSSTRINGTRGRRLRRIRFLRHKAVAFPEE